MKALRVNDKRIDPRTGQRSRPPRRSCRRRRKTPKITEMLPLLTCTAWTRATSSRAGAVPRLDGRALGAGDHQPTETWKAEQRTFADRDLSGVDYVYLWVDGIHVNIRLEQQKLCLLVMIGVRADGRKELVAMTDGYRESIESWADLLRDADAAGWAHRCWRSATARLGSGKRCVRCSQPPASSAAGSMSKPISLPRCRNRRTPRAGGDEGHLQR